MRKYLVLAAALAACGTEEDQRPATLEVVTHTVLAPNCGQAMCHSSAAKTEGLAFDTIDGTIDALYELEVDLAVADGRQYEQDLWYVLTGTEGLPRMPPETSLANDDIELIRTWMLDGAPGLPVRP